MLWVGVVSDAWKPAVEAVHAKGTIFHLRESRCVWGVAAGVGVCYLCLQQPGFCVRALKSGAAFTTPPSSTPAAAELWHVGRASHNSAQRARAAARTCACPRCC